MIPRLIESPRLGLITSNISVLERSTARVGTSCPLRVSNYKVPLFGRSIHSSVHAVRPNFSSTITREKEFLEFLHNRARLSICLSVRPCVCFTCAINTRAVHRVRLHELFHDAESRGTRTCPRVDAFPDVRLLLDRPV